MNKGLSAKIVAVDMKKEVDPESTESYKLTLKNNGSLIWPETIKVKRMDDRKNSISTRLCK